MLLYFVINIHTYLNIHIHTCVYGIVYIILLKIKHVYGTIFLCFFLSYTFSDVYPSLFSISKYNQYILTCLIKPPYYIFLIYSLYSPTTFPPNFMCFLFINTLALSIFPPLFCNERFLNLERMIQMIQMFHLKPYKVSCFLYIDGLWVSIIIPQELLL